ncbi:hypothetical protein QBC40DRAFT_33165 [Triangularia verruculosa]|uniref:Uncharacterized protein n=1 Tax=Triangularia verruculosa TaxID=2587418 RepID=A0AAN6X6S3_9PEZI|nr:hypothetical protein QBC40DRAFT_33165 [Triangularia verruculosa]
MVNPKVNNTKNVGSLYAIISPFFANDCLAVQTIPKRRSLWKWAGAGAGAIIPAPRGWCVVIFWGRCMASMKGDTAKRIMVPKGRTMKSIVVKARPFGGDRNGVFWGGCLGLSC